MEDKATQSKAHNDNRVSRQTKVLELREELGNPSRHSTKW